MTFLRILTQAGLGRPTHRQFGWLLQFSNLPQNTSGKHESTQVYLEMIYCLVTLFELLLLLPPPSYHIFLEIGM